MLKSSTSNLWYFHEDQIRNYARKSKEKTVSQVVSTNSTWFEVSGFSMLWIILGKYAKCYLCLVDRHPKLPSLLGTTRSEYDMTTCFSIFPFLWVRPYLVQSILCANVEDVHLLYWTHFVLRDCPFLYFCI